MKKTFVCATIIFLCCVLFVGCNNNSSSTNDVKQPEKPASSEPVVDKISIEFENNISTFVAGKTYSIAVSTNPSNISINLDYSILTGNEYASVSNNKLTIFENAKDGDYIKFHAKYKDIVSNELYVKIVNYDEQIASLNSKIAALQSENFTLDSQLRSLDKQLTSAMSKYDNYVRQYCSNGRDWDPGTPQYVKQQAMRYADDINNIEKQMCAVDIRMRSNNDTISTLQKKIASLEEEKAKS